MKENTFSTEPFTILFKAYPEDGIVYMDVKCKYAGLGIPCNSVEELRKEIEDICGKGSYLVKDSNGEYIKENGLCKQGNLTYTLQGFKTDVIETARKAAWLVWGYIPELAIGVWEESFRDIEELV